MYRKDSTGWIKHVDFIILDLICLQVAFVLAYVLSGYGANPYQLILYRNMAVFMEVADLVVLFAMGTLKNVLKRGYYKDFVVTAQHGVILGACLLLYLFMLQEGQQYSRLALILNIVIYILLTYLVRELWKHLLRKKMEDGENRSLLLVVSADVVSAVVESMKEHNYARYKIAGIAVIDKEMTGKYIDGVKVVANMENAAEYVCKEWIDEVLIVTSGVVPYPKELIEQFTETGVTVHLNLAKVQSVPGKKQFVEKVGDYTVLTTSINYASTRDLMLKRLMDIAGGLVGCLITGILFIFVAPAIYIASPGPIFFAQERVGKNGKRFKMYKFRSMYMDAEERKAELMKDNKLGDEKMFKLDFDPRVIGNKILPDGTHKTGIGDFIRRTSIDEFPQFFNVLKGDMSIIGTRPPLISETNFYELHHRARLAIKPGITGMWQVSGRSDITDFEEVVRLDKEYTGAPNEALTIGNNCSIAGSANFLLGGEHNYKCITTFPYRYRVFGLTNDVRSKGPIKIEDEVWIGDGAWILSGVTVGKGAIIATGSIVTRDVPPYAIVGGSPARIIKYRFSESIIKKIIGIDLANCELSVNQLDLLTKDITEENVDSIVFGLTRGEDISEKN